MKACPQNISSDVLIATFEGIRIDEKDEKYSDIQAEILNENYEDLTREEIISILKVMNGDYSRMIKAYQKPKFKKTQVNSELINKLEKDRIISSHKISKSIFDGAQITAYAFHEDVE